MRAHGGAIAQTCDSVATPLESQGNTPITMPLKADDLYDTASCSAILGVFLFRSGAPVDPATTQAGEPLQFCIGAGLWLPCPSGMPDVLKVDAEQARALAGLRTSELPADWGIVANLRGEVTHRGFGPGRPVREVHYLGRSGGDAACEPATLVEMGLAHESDEAADPMPRTRRGA